MGAWELELSDKYLIRNRWYEKKHPNELLSMLSNLDKYFKALQLTGNPLHVNAGFIHDEPNGIKGLDQKGGGKKTTLKQTRLYIYPYTKEKRLYLLTIGDKQSQNDDIKWCQNFVKRLKRSG